ncbi:hypothetical protein C6P40_005358, partial [Pichia californica]
MAKKGNKGKKSFSRRAESEKKGISDFGDAVLDASKFLNKNNNNNDDSDNDNFQFNDEELNSDDALGSDDDLDDYMVKKNKKNNNNNNSSLNEFGENDDGWDSVDEGELMTLSELWDRDDKELNSIKNNNKNSSKNKEI